MKIFVYNISYKSPTGPKPLCIRFDKIDVFIISPDGKIKHLVLFDYRLLGKICDKIQYLKVKKVVSQVVTVIYLEGLELIYIILYLLKKYWLFIML